MNVEKLMMWHLVGEIEVFGGNMLKKIPYDLAWDQTRVGAVERRRLTA
jgi:hypothetical protein